MSNSENSDPKADSLFSVGAGRTHMEEPADVTMKLTLPRGRRGRGVLIPTVRVVAGPDLLQFVTLSGGQEMVIGRDESAGLVLGDASVSRNHASLRCDDGGEISVYDLGSTNGTAVNGATVQRALLRPGDHLEIGAVSLRLDLLGLDELHHLSRVLERMRAAGTDPLTGLQTRAWLDERLPALLARCEDAGQPFSVIFLDVDRFKSINDTFGHRVGDQVLQALARLVLLDVRDSDTCARYGGEEILVFLPGTDEKGAADVAERLRKTIGTHDWSRTAVGLKVTASLGVAQKLPEEEIVFWLDRADRAMYQAKQSGRNAVRSASEPPSEAVAAAPAPS